MEEAGEIAKEYSRNASDERISQRVETMEESGTQIISLPDELYRQLVQRSQPVYEEIRESVSKEVAEKYFRGVDR